MSVHRQTGLATLLIALAGLGSGCGGISGSHSVSPATFLLPGLMRTEPPKAPPTEPVNSLVAGNDRVTAPFSN